MSIYVTAAAFAVVAAVIGTISDFCAHHDRYLRRYRFRLHRPDRFFSWFTSPAWLLHGSILTGAVHFTGLTGQRQRPPAVAAIVAVCHACASRMAVFRTASRSCGVLECYAAGRPRAARTAVATTPIIVAASWVTRVGADAVSRIYPCGADAARYCNAVAIPAAAAVGPI